MADGVYPETRVETQGWVLIWFQQFALASAAGREALELFRACADKQGEVDALLLLGNAWDSQEGLAKTEALEFKQQALTLAQSLGDKWRQAKALLHQKPDYRDRQRILADWEEARLLFRDVGDWRELTHLLGLVGWLRVWNGEIDLAQKYLDEATRSQALSSKAIIWVYAEMANESARDFQKNKQDRGIVFALEGMASLYVAIKKPDFAARLIGWADATREKIDDTRPTVEQADVDKLIAACLAKMGEVAFSDAYDEGQAMTLDNAIAYALKEDR